MIYTQNNNVHLPPLENILQGASFQYGLTAFETIRAYASVTNTHKFSIFAHEQHIERLFHTLGALDISIEYGKAEVEERLVQIVSELAPHSDYLIKILVFTTENSWSSSDNFEILYIVTENKRRISGVYPAKLLTASSRRPRPDNVSAKVKIGSNYSSNRLTQRITRYSGYDLPLFLNDLGVVSESSGAALLVYKDGAYLTPDTLETSLDSITLEFISEVLRHDGRPVIKKTLTVTDLYSASALFLIGTSVEIMDISQLDHMKYDAIITNSISKELLACLPTKHPKLSSYHKEV